MHRVHIVVDQEAVGAAPFGVTEDRLIGVARQPLGRGEGGRRGVRIGAVPGEDRAAMLKSRVAAHRALADQVAAGLARHRRHRTVAENLRAVIDADQAGRRRCGPAKSRAPRCGQRSSIRWTAPSRSRQAARSRPQRVSETGRSPIRSDGQMPYQRSYRPVARIACAASPARGLGVGSFIAPLPGFPVIRPPTSRNRTSRNRPYRRAAA